MNDDFVYGLRRDPRPEFADGLKARLQALDARAPASRFAPRVARWTALAASFAVVAFAFTLPSVQAGAQAFLDLFRVTTFAGVAFDPQRLSRIQTTGVDLQQMLGEQIESVEIAAAPVSYASPQEAGAAAGIRVYTPAWLPPGMSLTSSEVFGGGALRFTARTANLEQVLDALAIDDVTIPAGIDGQDVSVRLHPVVHLTYTGPDTSATLLEATSPEVSFPAGVDLASLGEIGLRILGLDRAEAYRFAQRVDWRTTLIVPVPVAVARFSEINVQGQPGLLIETSGERGSDRRPESILMWSRGDDLYVLRGTLYPSAALEMAQTLQ